MRRTNRLVHDRLAQALRDRFGWHLQVSADDESSLRAAIPVPGRGGHLLTFRCESNSIEVGYDDGLPPGPATQLFVFEPDELEDAIGEAVAGFVEELMAENIVVVREALPWHVRLVRRFDCTSLPWFRDRSAISGTSVVAVYSWKGTYDAAPGHDPDG
jgi:hypothetical protein